MILKPVEKDVLIEMSNVSMGSVATALSSLLNSVVRLSPPEITEMTTAVLQERHNKLGILVSIAFKAGLEGVNFLFLPEQDAAFLASLMLGKGDNPVQTVDFPELGVINEAMGIIIGSYSASLASFLGLSLEPEPPLPEQINPADKDLRALGFTETDLWVELSFTLEIKPDKKVNLLQFLPFPFLQAMVSPLLKGLEMDLNQQASSPFPGLDAFLNNMEQDTIAEIGNISLGSSATALSQLVDQRVQITTPKLALTTMEKLREQYLHSSVIVRVNYRDGLKGESILILKEEDAALIAGLMMGLPPGKILKTVGEMELSAVSEAMNQMMGCAATAMSDFLGRRVEISPPDLSLVNLQEEIVQVNHIDPGEPILQISFQLDIGELAKSKLIQVIPFPFAKEIASFLLQAIMNEEAVEGKTAATGATRGDADLSPVLEQGISRANLSEMQKDTLAELGNISLGSSATALSELINKKVNITTPRVTLTTMKEVSANYPLPCLIVMVNFIKGLDGNNVLIIKKEDALIIVGLMMGMEPPERPQELGEMEISAISEAMNQMMGSAATAMSEFLDRLIDISPPDILYKDLQKDNLDIVYYDENAPMVQVAFRMEVEGLIDSDLLQLIPLDFANRITTDLLSPFTGENFEDLILGQSRSREEDQIVSEQAVKIFEPSTGRPGEEEKELFFPGKEEQAAVVSFPGEVAMQLQDDEYAKLNLIRDISLEIKAVLGKTRVPLKKIFSLLPGEIVSLDRLSGEPVELFVHNRLVATGEIVMVNGQFGVKITSIVRSKY